MADDRNGLFKSGGPGGPGRPKGSRNKLTEDFLADLYADWQAGGKDALVAMRESKPNEYVRVVAGLMPAKLEVERPLTELSDNELASVLDAVRALIGHAEGVGAGPGGGDTTPPVGTPIN